MFESNPDFEEVSDDAMLWRYQDLPRYLDLLLRRQLFFNRADRFEDPFEGKFNKLSKELVVHSVQDTNGNRVAKDQAERRFEQVLKEVSEKRLAVTLNTWHQNVDENYAMWNIYAKGSYGLAVQTTFERLKNCFHAARESVYIGKVIYYDEHSEQIPIDRPFAPFLWKRSMYEYEKEVRCCSVVQWEDDQKTEWAAQDKYSGLFVPADLNMLIDRIFISPYSPTWFRELICRLNHQFGIHAEIRHSAVFNSENFY